MDQKDRVMENVVKVPFEQMELELRRILEKHGFDPGKAEQCAHLFAENTLDGVYTHGINRFPRFIQHIRDGYVRVHAEPAKKHGGGALEQWDGCLGPGPLNALFCTDRAIELSREHGIGCVALANTNHWMRGGHYGWKAAKAGFVFIGWTNTIANMPAWGAVDCHVGNNPLVIGVPYNDEAVVLDMAMSQFSYGTVEAHRLQGRPLAMPGGYDSDGTLTNDPSAILESRRLLPIGFWKGSGLALLLDIIAALLSGGLSTARISKQEAEYAVSQVFIAINPRQLSNHQTIADSVREVINDLHSSVATSDNQEILYPGERVLRARIQNLNNGIPVDRQVWDEVLSL